MRRPRRCGDEGDIAAALQLKTLAVARERLWRATAAATVEMKSKTAAAVRAKTESFDEKASTLQSHGRSVGQGAVEDTRRGSGEAMGGDSGDSGSGGREAVGGGDSSDGLRRRRQRGWRRSWGWMGRLKVK